jgi:hypothetical protein
VNFLARPEKNIFVRDFLCAEQASFPNRGGEDPRHRLDTLIFSWRKVTFILSTYIMKPDEKTGILRFETLDCSGGKI